MFDQDSAKAFRREVQEFCAANLPPDIKGKIESYVPLGREDIVRWQKILAARGWYVGHWPREHGGLGWGALQRFTFDEECTNAGAPTLPPFCPYYIGPVLYTFGSPEQQQRLLPAIRQSDAWWCQGYSEPGSGSDLYSLKTKAVRDGDVYRVNGQKIWTTTAHWADMIFCLVRTSTEPRKQAGISFLVIDMKSPGVTVRPITTMDMEHHVNEVFFDNVEVPVENLIGEEGRAWTYSHFLLSNERIIVAEPGKYRRMIRDVRQLARDLFEGGRPLLEYEPFRRRLAELDIRLRAVSALAERILGGHEQGGDVGPLTSILKLKGADLEQSVGELMAECLGRLGMPFQYNRREQMEDTGLFAPPAAAGMVGQYLYRRSISIAGGSSEMMRNIMAKSVFGLR
jgi:alkylation response protein AidB-like acyl-CoA dehydrogenase